MQWVASECHKIPSNGQNDIRRGKHVNIPILIQHALEIIQMILTSIYG